MNTKTNPQRHIRTIFNLFNFDSQRRISILKSEVNHLMRAIEFRIKSSDSRAKNENMSSDGAFLNRLLHAGGLLAEECQSEQEDLKYFNILRGKFLVDEEVESINLVNRRQTAPRSISWSHIEILWHAKLVHKATVIAERVEDLHNRLDQYLQRTSPDHPDPALRRRSENGLGDKYLNELCRWVHKDLARFAVEKMGARYPYKKVPSTFQYWSYDYSSRHNSFISRSGLESWKRFLDSSDEIAAQKIDDPGKFSVVSLSYWMPERLSFQPIIAHELAHQVLRDLYGKELNIPHLQHDDSEMSRLYRRITRCVEAWAAGSNTEINISPKSVSSLVVEILCDIFGLARFGASYLYAWIHEGLNEEIYAGLFHDRFGDLQCLSELFGKSDAFSIKDADISSLASSFQSALGVTAEEIPQLYIRGAIICRLFESSLDDENDWLAKDFHSGLKDLLALIADISSAGEIALWSFHDALVSDIVSVVLRGRNPIFRDDDFISIGSSPLAKGISSWWSSPDFGLKKQHMSEDMKDFARKTFLSFSSSTLPTAPHIPDSFHEVPWRLEWLLEVCRHEFQVDLAPAVSPNEWESRDAISECARKLYTVGMADYLSRVSSSARLISSFCKDEEGKRHPILSIRSSNSFSTKNIAAEHRSADNLLSQLDEYFLRLRKVRARGGDAAKLMTKTPAGIQLIDHAAAWLPSHSDSSRSMLARHIQAAVPSDSSVYFLELFKLAARSDVGNGFMSSDIRILPSTGGDSEPGYVSGALLGKYDAFSITKKSLHPYHQSTPTSWRFWAGDRVDLKYVSRSKQLIPIGSFDSDSFPKVSCIILVSLRLESTRLLVGRWINDLISSNTKLKFVKVFLSDGWEDLVVLIGDGDSNESPYGLLPAFVSLLRNSPFIASTETLFSSDLIHHADSDVFSFAFVCSFGDLKPFAFPSVLNRGVLDIGCLECRVENIAGNRDIEITPCSVVHASALHTLLHSVLPSDCRVETIVRWRSHDNEYNLLQNHWSENADLAIEGDSST